MCAEGGVLVQQLARRIAEHRGAALIADYGHDGTKTDTFRVRGRGLVKPGMEQQSGADRSETAQEGSRAPRLCRALKATSCTTSWTLLEPLTSPLTWTSATCAGWLEGAWPAWGPSLRGSS